MTDITHRAAFDLEAVSEAVGGVVLAGSPWWAEALFGAVLILKLATLVGGAVIAVHGARRVLFPKRNRRSTDRAPSPSAYAKASADEELRPSPTESRVGPTEGRRAGK